MLLMSIFLHGVFVGVVFGVGFDVDCFTIGEILSVGERFCDLRRDCVTQRGVPEFKERLLDYRAVM